MTKHHCITLSALLSLSGFALLGCDDDGDDVDAGPEPGMDAGPPDDDAGPPDDDAGPPDEDAGTDGGPPAPTPRGMANPPTLGAQVDRAGRAGVTTALVGTFTELDEADRNALKDAYNADDDPSSWVTDYQADIANNLGVIDGIDRACGNQLAAGAAPTADRYDALAGVLANDWLLVDSTDTACPEYLGVEAEALGVVADGGCGGRTPPMDVIERTYSVLVAGALAGVDDTVTFADEDGAHGVDTFPFLGPAL